MRGLKNNSECMIARYFNLSVSFTFETDLQWSWPTISVRVRPAKVIRISHSHNLSLSLLDLHPLHQHLWKSSLTFLFLYQLSLLPFYWKLKALQHPPSLHLPPLHYPSHHFQEPFHYRPSSSCLFSCHHTFSCRCKHTNR